MKHALLAALAGVSVLAASGAQAGTYKCVDEKGVTHYGDRLPAQCANAANSELSKRGVVLKQNDRALTAEEKEARLAAAERQKQEAQKEAEQRRRDQALLSSYSSEQEIDLARDREIARVENWISSTKATQAKQTSPEERKKLDAMVDKARKEAEEIRAKYDGYKARYIELKNADSGKSRMSKL